MRECVLDASVVLEWFSSAPPASGVGPQSLRSEFEGGELQVLAPSLIHLEIVNVAGRRWEWGPDALQELAEALEDLSFDLVEPELSAVARWVAAGLTAYDAAYVAVAEAAAVPLFTSDQSILGLAPGVAQPPP
jgi:predicted nucleic acid-binding protein